MSKHRTDVWSSFSFQHTPELLEAWKWQDISILDELHWYGWGGSWAYLCIQRRWLASSPSNGKSNDTLVLCLRQAELCKISVSILHRNDMAEIEHPDVYDNFLKMEASRYRWGYQTTVDQAIEETVNKCTQTVGETKGFSLTPGAGCRSTCLRKLRQMIKV